MHPSPESMKKTAGAIDSLIKLGFINDKIREEYHQNQHQHMHSHTHINVTPEIRQRVVGELQEDEDLKEWWDTCKKYVQMDYDALKVNKQKFVKT
jgi:SpoVK/Ycf46/Vps4 family AAA+-type ATPase